MAKTLARGEGKRPTLNVQRSTFQVRGAAEPDSPFERWTLNVGRWTFPNHASRTRLRRRCFSDRLKGFRPTGPSDWSRVCHALRSNREARYGVHERSARDSDRDRHP